MKTVDTLVAGQTQPMIKREEQGKGRYLYDCTITCRDSGRYGFTARVKPRGDDFIKLPSGLVTWAQKPDKRNSRP